MARIAKVPTEGRQFDTAPPHVGAGSCSYQVAKRSNLTTLRAPKRERHRRRATVVMISPKPLANLLAIPPGGHLRGPHVDRARSDRQEVQPKHARNRPVVRECARTVRGKPGPDGRKAIDKDPQDRVRIVVLDDREQGQKDAQEAIQIAHDFLHSGGFAARCDRTFSDMPIVGQCAPFARRGQRPGHGAKSPRRTL